MTNYGAKEMTNPREAQTPPQRTAQSTLDAGLSTLENAIAELQDRINVLATRLTPVLSSMDIPSKEHVPSIGGDSPLLRQLRTYQVSIDVAVEKVNTLLGQLEV